MQERDFEYRSPPEAPLASVLDHRSTVTDSHQAYSTSTSQMMRRDINRVFWNDSKDDLSDIKSKVRTDQSI